MKTILSHPFEEELANAWAK